MIRDDERRLWCPAHLARLRKTQTCAVRGCFSCGPIEVHHIKRSSKHQNARGLTSGDDEAIPLGVGHHRPGFPGSIHQALDEWAWCYAHGIDPVATPAAHWAESMRLGYSVETVNPKKVKSQQAAADRRAIKKSSKPRPPIRPMHGFRP